MPFSVLSLTPAPTAHQQSCKNNTIKFLTHRVFYYSEFFPLQSYKLESSNGYLGVFSTFPGVIDKNTAVFDGSGL